MPASLGQPFVVKTEGLRRSEFGGGPRSEMGSRSRRESERAREGEVVKSGRGRSEAVARKAGEVGSILHLGLHVLGWARTVGLYTCTLHAVKGEGEVESVLHSPITMSKI